MKPFSNLYFTLFLGCTQDTLVL